jgi:hypothetical protein
MKSDLGSSALLLLSLRSDSSRNECRTVLRGVSTKKHLGFELAAFEWGRGFQDACLMDTAFK